MLSTTSGTAYELGRFLAVRLAEGERQVAAWAEEMAGEERSEHDLSHLKIALQCGGSDAFSGISGNPAGCLGGARVDPLRRRGQSRRDR